MEFNIGKNMMKNKHTTTIRSLTRKHLTWETAKAYAFILIGALVQALAMRLFLIPSKLVSGGISGMAQLINHYTAWPVGLMVLVGNAPLFILGWRYLGGSRFALAYGSFRGGIFALHRPAGLFPSGKWTHI